MSLEHSGNLSVRDVIPQLDKAFKLLALMNAQLDAVVFGGVGIGLGTLQAEASAQLAAAVQASVNVGLSISNPVLGFQLAVAASAALIAQLQIAMASPFLVGVNVSASLTASAALVAALEIKVGGLNAAIQAVLDLKAQIAILDLTPGPVAMYWWDATGTTPTLTQAGVQIQAEFAMTGNRANIAPGAPSYGILLVTQVPAAWTLLKKIFKTS